MAVAGRRRPPTSTRRSAAIFREHGADPAVQGLPQRQGEAAFPAVICASVNEQVVHGIPNRPPLKDGRRRLDRHRLQAQRLVRRRGRDPRRSATSTPRSSTLDVTRPRPLDLAIRAMAGAALVGGRRADGAVRQEPGVYVVEKFVGHGIGQDMHEEPQVPNFVSKRLRKNDIRLEPGLVLAIEPMVNAGKPDVNPRRPLDGGDRSTASRACTSSTPWA